MYYIYIIKTKMCIMQLPRNSGDNHNYNLLEMHM